MSNTFFMQQAIGAQNAVQIPARSFHDFRIGMRVLVTEGRPYREATIVATASRYRDEKPDYFKVQYTERWPFKLRYEWVYEGCLAVIQEEQKENI